jgi:hypothetical protein
VNDSTGPALAQADEPDLARPKVGEQLLRTDHTSPRAGNGQAIGSLIMP